MAITSEEEILNKVKESVFFENPLGRILSKIQKRQLASYFDNEKDQHLYQRDKIFDLVLWCTKWSFILVALIIIFQVFDFDTETSFPWVSVEFHELDYKNLSIILTGFLAETFILTRIIIKGLYNKEQ